MIKVIEQEQGGVLVKFDGHSLTYSDLEWNYLEELIDFKINEYLEENSLSADEGVFLGLKADNDLLEQKIRAHFLKEEWDNIK